MSKEQEEKIERAMKNAAASLAIDGLYVTDEETELVRKHLRGEMTHQEFLDRALDLAKMGKRDRT